MLLLSTTLLSIGAFFGLLGGFSLSHSDVIVYKGQDALNTVQVAVSMVFGQLIHELKYVSERLIISYLKPDIWGVAAPAMNSRTSSPTRSSTRSRYPSHTRISCRLPRFNSTQLVWHSPTGSTPTAARAMDPSSQRNRHG